jgi:hypothetical protein
MILSQRYLTYCVQEIISSKSVSRKLITVVFSQEIKVIIQYF